MVESLRTETLGEIATPTGNSGQNKQGQLIESARQFEALLIGQIMRTMRESAGGWLGSGEDQAGASMAEFAEQQMAQLLSASGGFGLASLIVQGLARSPQPQTLQDSASASSAAPG
jgi:Rod binding domain-containing protein